MASKNKIALLTGGSRGIGRSAVLALAKKGIDIVFTYNSNKQAANEVIKEVQALGQKCTAFQLDTSTTKMFSNFIQQLTAYLNTEYGNDKIDFLINNAGTGLYTNIVDTTEQQVDEIFNIHFKGVFFLTQQLLPIINNGGGIINISSGLTRRTQPGSSVYAAIKGAIEHFSRYLALEIGARKIRVNVVAPGAVETDFGGGRTRDNKEINAQIAGITAFGRAGLPEDIGGIIAFLCTDDAAWITAQRIEASGGLGI